MENYNENLKKGYIKLHRSLLEWEWYDELNVKVLFIHCLLKANYTDKDWKGQIIHRGSFITSYEKLSIETGLTVQQIRTAILKLKSTNEIIHKSTSHYSMITINNYDLYQTDNIQNDTQITNNQQTNNKQITTTKERKEIKNQINHHDELMKKSLKKKIGIEEVPDVIKNNPQINNPCGYWASLSEEDKERILEEEQQAKNWEKEVDEAVKRFEEKHGK